MRSDRENIGNLKIQFEWVPGYPGNKAISVTLLHAPGCDHLEKKTKKVGRMRYHKKRQAAILSWGEP